MQIVQTLAGYSLGRADQLRRAMSKKKRHVMEVERRNFIEGIPDENIPGCVNNGISAEIAGHIYDSMMDFAEYAFNKSHAACYAVVAVQTAWLKARYPVEFMAALLTSVIDATPKLSAYMAACRIMNIPILPPDINEGSVGFTVTVRPDTGEHEIRYALTAVRGVGRGLIRAIEEERRGRGHFTSLEDFCRRMAGGDLNRRSLESLIKAGAFDSLGGTRRQYLEEGIINLEQAQREAKDNVAGQMSLFDLMGPQETAKAARKVEEFERGQLLMMEKEVLGVYVSGHPLESDVEFLEKRVTNQAADFVLDEERGEPGVPENARALLGGLIAECRVRYTKNNQAMAILQLEDLSGPVEVVVFPKCYEKCSHVLQEDTKVLISGRVAWESERDAKLIAEDITPFSEAPRTVWVQFANKEAYAAQEELLNSFIQEASAVGGKSQCIVYLREEKQKKKIETPRGLTVTDPWAGKLRATFGEDNVKIV